MKLDIGCSYHKLPGYLGVDIEAGLDIDVLADMHALPFKTSSVDLIHTRHMLEHVDDPHKCIKELYRICRPDGIIKIIVPHYSNPAYWADMTHKRPFSVRSFEYFDLEFAEKAGFPIYQPNINLKTLKKRLTFWPERIYIRKSFLKRFVLKFLDRLFSGLANLNPILCERTWCNWVGGFYEVTFELQALKDRNL